MAIWFKRVAIAFAALLTVIIVSLYVVVATEVGTRWMFARVETLLPAQMQIDGIGGSLLTGLSVDEFRWRDEKVDIIVLDIYSNIKFRPLLNRHVSVETLSIQSVDVTTRVAADEETDAEPFAVELPLKISLAESEVRDIAFTTSGQTSRIDVINISGEAYGNVVHVQDLTVASDWLGLQGELRANLAPPYEIDSNLIWSLDKIITESIAGSLSVDGDSSAYRVNHMLELPQNVQSTGTVSILGGDLQFDIENRWDELDWPIDDTQRVMSSGGILHLNGDLEEYQANGSTSIQLNPWPIADVQIAGQGSLTAFELSQLQVASELGNATATGNVDWAADPNWMFAYSVTGLQIDRLQSDINGDINLEGTVVGNISADEQLVLDVRANRVSGLLNEHQLEGEITVGMQNGAVDLADSWLAINQNRVDARGRLAPEIGMALDWKVQDFGEILSVAEGQSEGNANIEGSATGWTINTDLEAGGIKWQDYGVESLSLKGEFSTTGSLSGTLQGKNILINEQTIETLGAKASGSVEQHVVQIELQASDRRLQFESRGAYIDKQWLGDIDSFQFADGDRTTWVNERPVPLAFSAEGAESNFCLQETQSTSRVCAEASYQAEVGALNATVERVPLSMLMLTSIAKEIEFAGSVGAELALDWQDQKLNGTAVMQLNEAVVTANLEGEEIVAAVERGVANASITDNNLNATAELQLAERGFGRSEISIADITDPQSSLNSQTTVEFTDLGFAPLVVPTISDVSGTVHGALNITGVLSEPELGGSLRLDDGAFRITNAGVAVTNVDVEVLQAGNGELSLEGSAQSGEGQIRISGDSRVNPELGLQTALTISGENFEFVRLPEWQAIASPNIQVRIDNESATVRGSLAVPSAQVTLQSLPETAERVSPDATVFGRDADTTSAERRIDLDVETTLGERVALSGFGLETNLTGGLRLTGGSGEPLIGIGRIDLRDGRYEAYGQQLDIENGALLFSGPLTNPTLDIRAVREVGGVTAGLQLSGTPNDLRSTVFSEPVLNDAEALSYLIAGRPLAVADDEESNRVGQAAFALGLTGADKVIAQVQSKLGLDTLSLDSSDDVGRIVAGRRIGGRLLVEYGYGLVDRLGTLLLRYQLNDRVIVETTTGTASTLDVVYSVKKN